MSNKLKPDYDKEERKAALIEAGWALLATVVFLILFILFLILTN